MKLTKHLSQRLDYEVATDAGDMCVFLCFLKGIGQLKLTIIFPLE